MTMSRAKAMANVLRDALKQEKKRFDKAENIHFVELKRRKQSALLAQSFPRTLENGTFFTPHLQSRRPDGQESGIVKEYMVIIPRDNKIVTAKSAYNPVREQATQLPMDLPLAMKGKVYNLEKSDYRFVGTNKEILVFERQFNQKQRDKHWAWALASTLLGSVTALSAAIFAGQYIYE